MRILNTDNVEILNPNYDLGHLVEEKIFIKHHEAVEAIEEQGHWKTIAEYPNGGKDVEWIVDVPAVKASEAYDEYEDIYRYILYTEDELNEIEMEKNKPTQLDRIEAQVTYTAMMTDTLLEEV